MKTRLGFANVEPERPIFIHIAKTAGGALAECLGWIRQNSTGARLMGTWPNDLYFADYKDGDHATIIRVNPTEKTMENVYEMHNMQVPIGTYKYYTIVRNPFDRLVSRWFYDGNRTAQEFNDACEGKECKFDEELEFMNQGYRWHLAHVPDEDLLYVGQQENFDEAVRNIVELLNITKVNQLTTEKRNSAKKEPLNLSPNAKRNLRRFLAPEYDFLEERFGIVYDRP